MATRSVLRAKVALRTRRSAETDFDSIVNEAFDEFLVECGRFYNFREMKTTITAAITSTNYTVTMPTQTSLTGFDAAVHQILNVKGRKTDGAEFSYDVDLRSHAWLDEFYPDRSRSAAISEQPFFVARYEGLLETQAPVRDDYDIIMQTSHLPSVFAGDSTENPLPSLDNALVAYATFLVTEVTEHDPTADRWFNRAYQLRNLAMEADKKEPALVHKAVVRGYTPLSRHYRFDLGDLQDVYP